MTSQDFDEKKAFDEHYPQLTKYDTLMRYEIEDLIKEIVTQQHQQDRAEIERLREERNNLQFRLGTTAELEAKNQELLDALHRKITPGRPK
jgi:hypothetical protein